MNNNTKEIFINEAENMAAVVNEPAEAGVMSVSDGVAVASTYCCPTNSDMESAQEIALETSINGCICCPGSEQWFKFTVPNSDTYTIYTTGDLDTVGTLYDCNGAVATNDDFNGRINFRIVKDLGANITYYIRVTGAKLNIGNYTLMVTEKIMPESCKILTDDNEDVIVLKEGVTYELPRGDGYPFLNISKTINADFSVEISPSDSSNKKVYWWTDINSDVISVNTAWKDGERYQTITAKAFGTGYLYAEDWAGKGRYDVKAIKVLPIDFDQFETDGIEFHLLCNGDSDNALRVGSTNLLNLNMEKPVRGERLSYWNRQKWTVKNSGNTKKLYTQLNEEYYLCNKIEDDINQAYVSTNASVTNSELEIIPYGESGGLYEIKLANSDLYLTLVKCYRNGYDLYWGEWRTRDSNNSAQLWKIEPQPINHHRGVDAGKILNETTIQALKSENTEFVIRYYKILDTLKGVDLRTLGSTLDDYTVIDNTILELQKQGINLDVENYLEYADTIPLNDGNLFKGDGGESLITDEKNLYNKHNINIVSVYQNEGTKYEYFTEKHAKLDALSALMSAKTLGQPSGTAIYFAVDYDTTANQLERIRNYFNIIKNKIGGRYKIGVYGNGLVCSEIKPRYASYSWLSQSTDNEGTESYQHYENYDTPAKYNIKQAEECSCNDDFDDDVAVGNDYGQWYI